MLSFRKVEKYKIITENESVFNLGIVRHASLKHFLID